MLHHASAHQADHAHGVCMLSCILVSVSPDMRAASVTASGLEKTEPMLCVRGVHALSVSPSGLYANYCVPNRALGTCTAFM